MLMFQIGHAGLTLATSTGAITNSLLLYRAMRRADIYAPLPGWGPFHHTRRHPRPKLSERACMPYDRFSYRSSDLFPIAISSETTQLEQKRKQDGTKTFHASDLQSTEAAINFEKKTAAELQFQIIAVIRHLSFATPMSSNSPLRPTSLAEVSPTDP